MTDSASTSQRATLADVATAAGVSHQTVSNVLRERGRVGDATRARVRAAIDELGYLPHAGASSLRNRRAGRLGHPIPTDELHGSNPIMLEFLQGLTASASARGQRLQLMPGDDSDASELVSAVRAVEVDGLVLASVTPGDPRVLALAAAGVPFACFGRPDAEPAVSWVDVDNYRANHAITRRLLVAGHERIAFLGYEPLGPWDLDREQGYRDAMTEAGLPPRVVTAPFASAPVRAAVDDLVKGDDPPQAVVTGSDLLAAVVYSVAAAHGLRIGTDLAVTGFDGSSVGRVLTPTLTTWAIPVAAIAARLVDIVLAQVERPAERITDLLMPDLLEGESG